MHEQEIALVERKKAKKLKKKLMLRKMLKEQDNEHQEMEALMM